MRPQEEIQKKVKARERERREKQNELSSEASHPDQAWLDCFFFFFATAVAWVTLHRPR